MPVVLADVGAYSQAEQSVWLTAAIAAELATAKAHLAATPFTPSPLLTLADLLEASYTGYAAQNATTWDGPFDQADGSTTIVDTALLDFGDNTDPADVTVYGIYVTDTGGTVLLFSATFDQPVTIPAGLPGPRFALEPSLRQRSIG